MTELDDELLIELVARYRRHRPEESEFMAGLMEGWLQAIALATRLPVETVRKDLKH